jgi:GR25 family glycosyltransferase involved in LPS biosynthesis
MEEIPIYITHYDKVTERKEYLKKNLPLLKMPKILFYSNYCDRSTIYRSINPSMVNITPFLKQFKEKFTDNNIRGQLLLPSKPGYLGNFLNHITVWKAIAEGNDEYGLILEDDTVLLENSYEILKKQLENIPTDLDIGYLHSGCNYTVQNYYGITPEPDDIWIKTPKRLSRTMCTYILSKNAAQRLMKVVFPISFNIDHEINFLQSVLNFNVYWTVEHALAEGSLINTYKSYVS